PILPTPLAKRGEIHSSLDRNPISARGKDGRCGQRDDEVGVPAVRQAGRGVNQRPRKRAAILVEEDVERSCRARSIEIYSLHIHFIDGPSLPRWDDEIVGPL